MNDLPDDLKELESALSQMSPKQPSAEFLRSLQEIAQTKAEPNSKSNQPALSILELPWVRWGFGLAAVLALLMGAVTQFPMHILSPDSNPSKNANEEPNSGSPMLVTTGEPDTAGSSTQENKSIPLAIEELGVLDLQDGAPIQFIRMRTLDYSISSETEGTRVIRTQAHEQILPVRMNYY